MQRYHVYGSDTGGEDAKTNPQLFGSSYFPFDCPWLPPLIPSPRLDMTSYHSMRLGNESKYTAHLRKRHLPLTLSEPLADL